MYFCCLGKLSGADIPAPMTFDTINCGETIVSTTKNVDDQVSSDICFATTDITYTGGDQSFYFEVASTKEVHFSLITPDSSGLDLFLFILHDEGDVDSIQCIDSRTSEGVDILPFVITLLPSKYMLVIDGRETYSTDVDTSTIEAGEFSITMNCYDDDNLVLNCGDSMENNTQLAALSSFESSHYEACIPEVIALDYRAPDQRYRFDLSQPTFVEINMVELDSVNLDLFLFSDSLDEDGIHVPASCMAISVQIMPRAGELIDTLLPAGTYWIVVDGQVIASDPGPFTQVGGYKLWMKCFDRYVTDLSCGLSVLDDNVEGFDGSSAIDYLACLPNKIYSGVDRSYRLSRKSRTEITISLGDTEADFALILREERYDSTLQAWAPGPCLAISDTGQLHEEIIFVIDSGSYWITVDAEEDVSDTFLLAVTCVDLVFPVELIGPFGEKTEEGIRITWRTLLETDNEGFWMERSRDGLYWERLDFIPGMGHADSEVDYAFVDTNPHGGVNYFRLVQIDFDGSVNYSDIIQFDVESRKIWSVRPSIIQNSLHIEGPESHARLLIYDSFGARMVDQGIISGDCMADFSQMQPGVYYVKIIQENTQQVFPVLKM